MRRVAQCDQSGEEAWTLREERWRGKGWWDGAQLQTTMQGWMTGSSRRGGAIDSWGGDAGVSCDGGDVVEIVRPTFAADD